jgi:hypothetical protein
MELRASTTIAAWDSAVLSLFAEPDPVPPSLPEVERSRRTGSVRAVVSGLSVLLAVGAVFLVSGTGARTGSGSPGAAPSTNTILGQGRVWPAEDAIGARGDVSGSRQVSESFAVAVLGLRDPIVTMDPSMPSNGPAIVRVGEAGTAGATQLLTAPMRDGTWAVLQVGDSVPVYSAERNTVSFGVPSGTAVADLFIRTTSGMERHRQGVTAGGSQAPVSGPPLSAIAVFWNRDGTFAGAAGGHFGFPG